METYREKCEESKRLKDALKEVRSLLKELNTTTDNILTVANSEIQQALKGGE